MTERNDEIQFTRLIQPDLQRVRGMLRRTCGDVPEFIRPLIEHGALDCGKLLRPAFLLLSGRVFGSATQNHIRAATSLELIHNASLLHDDVLDRGLIRRGVATVNQRWGNQAAVLLGDLLLGKALVLSASLPGPARSALGQVIQRTCDGELGQVAAAGDLALPEPQYLALITEKTAAMFEGACGLGARLAGASQNDCQVLAKFGRSIGIAYQIADDLLDLIGDDNALCKTLGTDLQGGKLTLPLIHAIRVLAEPRRTSLLTALQVGRLTKAELLNVLTETGSTDYVLAYMDTCTKQAIESVGDLRQSLAKATLLEVPRWVARQTIERISIAPAGALGRRLAGHSLAQHSRY